MYEVQSCYTLCFIAFFFLRSLAFESKWRNNFQLSGQAFTSSIHTLSAFVLSCSDLNISSCPLKLLQPHALHSPYVTGRASIKVYWLLGHKNAASVFFMPYLTFKYDWSFLNHQIIKCESLPQWHGTNILYMLFNLSIMQRPMYEWNLMQQPRLQ